MVNLADIFFSHLPGKSIEEFNSHVTPSCSLENDSGMNEKDEIK